MHDLFFNGRRGYRAHYWVDPNVGNAFDDNLCDLFRQAVDSHMLAVVEGRMIIVNVDSISRDESDGGPCRVTREFALQSLTATASKVWICEWLINGNPGLNERQSLGIYEPRSNGRMMGDERPSEHGLISKGDLLMRTVIQHRPRIQTSVRKQIHDTGWT